MSGESEICVPIKQSQENRDENNAVVLHSDITTIINNKKSNKLRYCLLVDKLGVVNEIIYEREEISTCGKDREITTPTNLRVRGLEILF